MWQNASGMFFHGEEGEEEKAEDDRDLDLDYKDDYDHEDNWDQEELLVDNKEVESNNNNEEGDDDGYTASERAYMNVINTLEDNDSVEMVKEQEQEQEQEESCTR